MPSETLSPEVKGSGAHEDIHAVLRPARDAFHSALARTIEQVRTFLDARPTSAEARVRDIGASLGAFAAGRVDPERFAALQTHSLSLDDSDAERVQRAFEVLQGINERFESLLALTVPPGGSLRDCVAGGLAEIGRAFGAAHVVQAIRSGSFEEGIHADMLEAYPFARWSRAERDLAPALLVEVAGADVRAASLAEFMDGAVRIVLSVDGPVPVAPLARLVAPRTFVAQGADATVVDALAGWAGHGIAALLPAGAARFQHDPSSSAGLEFLQRPEGRPRAVGGCSTDQQEEDLALLETLTRTGEPTPAVSANDADDVAGRLAGWLLQQARLDGEG